MAYYLGRDLDIALTTENASFGLVAEENSGDTGVETMVLKDFDDSDGSIDNFVTADDAAGLFAGPKLQKNSNSVFGTQTYDGISSATADNRPDNMTGVDISLSTMDEDVQFIGHRIILKTEIKKEN